MTAAERGNDGGQATGRRLGFASGGRNAIRLPEASRLAAPTLGWRSNQL